MNGKLIIKMIAALGIITVVAAALMAWVNELTADKIAGAAEAARLEAITDVVGKTPFDNSPSDDRWTPANDSTIIVYPLILKGKYTGAAVESYSLEGFDGEVRVMYGFDKAGDVTGYTVLKQSETPGLGTKMQDWFRDPTGARSIIGKNSATTRFSPSKDGGSIDAITAATISSRAFLQALRKADDARKEYEAHE